MGYNNKEYTNAWQKQARSVKRYKLKQYLIDHPCIDCGETDLRCLDFDHRDPTLKKCNVSKMVGGGSWSWNSCLEEIAKCDVRCANCHRKKTYANVDWLHDNWIPEGYQSTVEKQTGIPHGTKNGYSYHKCRCSLCTAAQREYQRHYLKTRSSSVKVSHTGLSSP